MPRVSIVVLNWNNYEDTRKCLESLRKVIYSELRVLVVDNGSSDGSGRRLVSEFREFEFIFNDKNLGFSRGCNVGIRAALEDEGCGYVLLLNNDTIVTANFLDKAIEHAEANASAGLIGGKILTLSDPSKIWYAGGSVNCWKGRMVVRGYGEKDCGQYDEPVEVGFVTGALMMIKREVIEKVGPLPEEYFFGVEEMDYSVSVMKAGYKLYYVPEFFIYHLADGSHYNSDPKFVYNSYRNKLIFAEKFLPKGLFPIWKLVFSIYAKYLAQRVWRGLIKKYDYDELATARGKVINMSEMKYALDKAIKDHGRDALSEETLTRFDEGLKKRRRVMAE